MRFPYKIDRGDFFAIMMAILNSPAPVVPTPQYSSSFADYVAHWFVFFFFWFFFETAGTKKKTSVLTIFAPPTAACKKTQRIARGTKSQPTMRPRVGFAWWFVAKLSILNVLTIFLQNHPFLLAQREAPFDVMTWASKFF